MRQIRTTRIRNILFNQKKTMSPVYQQSMTFGNHIFRSRQSHLGDKILPCNLFGALLRLVIPDCTHRTGLGLLVVLLAGHCHTSGQGHNNGDNKDFDTHNGAPQMQWRDTNAKHGNHQNLIAEPDK